MPNYRPEEICYYDNENDFKNSIDRIQASNDEIKTSDFKISIDFSSETILVETSKRLSERVPSLKTDAINYVINSLRNSIRSNPSSDKNRNKVSI